MQSVAEMTTPLVNSRSNKALISGNIHEELLSNCLLSPVDAIIYAEMLLASGIDFLLEELPEMKFVVVCNVGNHSRITNQSYYQQERGNSLEYFMYHHLKNRYKDNERVEFIIAEGYHVYVDVFDYTLRFHHGHRVRYYLGGVGGLTIPYNKAIAQWNKLRVATVDVSGHYHSYNASRYFVSNGSLIGFNAFALANKFDYEPPMQAFFLINRRWGRSMDTPIFFS